jgi:hypothetical protein
MAKRKRILSLLISKSIYTGTVHIATKRGDQRARIVDIHGNVWYATTRGDKQQQQQQQVVTNSAI